MTYSNMRPLGMTNELESPDGQEVRPTVSAPVVKGRNLGTPIIRVFGCGGGGCNAVERMCRESIGGVVEYFGVNTDAQHLSRCKIPNRIPMGQVLTRGLGVGGNPELGRKAAEESRDELASAVAGADMVFVAAGMGGGTGTGAAPVVAELAKEAGALTVAVVSRPFSFEASVRRQNAEDGLSRLSEHVDTLIVVPNDRLLQLENYASPNFTWEDALALADSVLLQGIQAISEVVTVPGDINVDFADLKTIMSNAGAAWLAIGKGSGEQRAIAAAQMAVKSPLLDIELEGAKRILFVITGGKDLTLKEVESAAGVIQRVADDEANIIFGTCRDAKLEDEVRVTLVASAFPINRDELSEESQEDLLRFLQDSPQSVEESEELDVPTFLRRKAPSRRRGFFR